MTKPDTFKPTAFPACWGRYFKGALSVAALNTGTETLSPYSNWGESVEIAAPGTGILTYGTGNKLSTYSGTSYAAPQVAAATALLISTFKENGWYYSPWLIEDILLAGSPVSDPLKEKFTSGHYLDLQDLSQFMTEVASWDDDERRHFVGDNQRDGNGWKPDEDIETIDQILISASKVELKLGQSTQFKAIAFFKDGSAEDVTNKTFWTSESEEHLSIDNFSGLAKLTALPMDTNVNELRIIGHYKGFQDKLQVALLRSTLPSVSALEISVPDPVYAQTNIAISAIATYSDGSKKDVSRSATWSSSDPVSLAPTSIPGMFSLWQALGGHSYQVNAQYGGKTATGIVTVSNRDTESFFIESRVGTSIFKGQVINLRSVFSFSGTTDLTPVRANWTSQSSNLSLTENDTATVAISTQSLALGDYTIRATAIDRSGNTAVTVVATFTFTVTDKYDRLEVLTSTPIIKFTERAQLNARAYYPNNSYEIVTSKAQWTSSNPTKLSVDSNGVVYPAPDALGQYTLTATFEGQSASINIAVIPYDIVDGTDAELVLVQITMENYPRWSQRGLFNAWGYYTDGRRRDITQAASWSSSNDAEYHYYHPGWFTQDSSVYGGGSYIITAMYGGLQGQLRITIPKERYQWSEFYTSSSGCSFNSNRELEVTNFVECIVDERVHTILPDGKQTSRYIRGTWSSSDPVFMNPAPTPSATNKSKITLNSETLDPGIYNFKKSSVFRGNGLDEPIETSGTMKLIESSPKALIYNGDVERNDVLESISSRTLILEYENGNYTIFDQ